MLVLVLFFNFRFFVVVVVGSDLLEAVYSSASHLLEAFSSNFWSVASKVTLWEYFFLLSIECRWGLDSFQFLKLNARLPSA